MEIMIGDLANHFVRQKDLRSGIEGHFHFLADPVQGNVKEIHLWGANEASDEFVVWLVVKIHRGVDLLDVAQFHDDDAGAHGHGFHLIVGDIDEGGLEFLMEFGDLRSHLGAQFGVQVRKRLIQQEDFRVTHDGTAQGDTLSLAAGHCLWLAVEIFFDAKDLRRFIDPFLDFLFRQMLVPERESHILKYRHMGI